MNELQRGILILLLSVTCASLAQILLKSSANREHSSWLKEYVNLRVLTGYALLFGSTILTIAALKTVPLSWSPAIESLSYLIVAVLGFFILKERFTRKKAAGLAVILAGVLILVL